MDAAYINQLSPEKRELLELLIAESGNQFNYFPLSFAQQRLWFIEQLNPLSCAHNIFAAVQLTGALDIEALERSVQEIVKRHETLRTNFVVVKEQPMQIVATERSISLLLVNLQELSKSKQEVEVKRLAIAEAQKPFDLTIDPLLRITLLQLSQREHVLLLTMHHIIADGWSLGVFVRELATLYGSFLTGKSSPLPALPIQYADFASWQRQWLHGEVLQEKLAYWQQQLQGELPVLELPTDQSRPTLQSFRGTRHPITIPPCLTESLKRLGYQEDSTLFMTLFAAFQVLLYRYTGQDDILVGTPIANRLQSETDSLIGCFVNMLVLRTDLTGNPSFRELLRQVRQVALGAYAHQELPFDKLVESIATERNLSHHPLFQVMFVLQNAPMPALELPGLTLQMLNIDSQTAQFDLKLDLWETPAGLHGWFEYNTDLFDKDTIDRMAGHWQTLVAGIVDNPEQRLSDLPLLPSAEVNRILVEWSGSRGAEEISDPTYSTGCIHKLFEAQVERSPDAVAVVFQREQIGYSQLNRQANQLARYLQKLGVSPEVRVGICLDRTSKGVEILVGLLGILKAGGAYVPLDPAYPPERIALMLQDAEISVLLTQAQLVERLPAFTGPIVCLDRDWKSIQQESQENLNSQVLPSHNAYIIYTSGSTGQPKGVVIEHQSAVAFLNWATQVFTPEEMAGVLASTSICFDLSVFEIFAPLSSGGQVILAENAISLPDLPAGDRVTLINTVPTAIAELLRVNGIPNSVCTVNLAGEPLPKKLVEQLHQNSSIRRVFNLYGPSEDTTYSTFTLVKPEDRVVMIGQAIANSQAYVLDRHLQPVAIGVRGELYLGGAGLARGYFHRPDLTAEKFIPNPFSNQPGARLYKTGDLVRYCSDGCLEFLGRIDRQVKIRGFRVELGEIEAILEGHPAIQDAIVIVREDIPGDKHLVAYIVAHRHQELEVTVEQLRGFLLDKLPNYMVPSALVLLESLPLTPNGKVDRRSLPAPDRVQLLRAETFVAPRTAIEEMVGGIWCDVLRLEQVGIFDNFFSLGGHSLLATQVISRVRETYQIDLPLRSFFEAPTITDLAARIETIRQLELAFDDLPILPASRDQLLPLSFAQSRLWFLEQLQPGNSAYNIPAEVRLQGQLDIPALERSLNEIVRRHEVLRTTFVVVDGKPVQAIAPTLTLRLPIIDLRQVSETERELEVQRLATAEAQKPFALETEALLRVTLLQLAETEYVALLTLHHIISDGWSITLLVRELASLYGTLLEGLPSSLDELPIQYADFALWQHQCLSGKVFPEQLSYWKKQLSGSLPILELPTDRPRSPQLSFQGGTRSLMLSLSLSQALKTLSQREGVTLFMTLLAAFKTLLYRYTNREDIVIGSPIAGRNHAATEPLIGFFINTLVLRTNVSGDLTFRELLGRVREVALGAYTHQDLPFEKLLEELQPERDLSRNPLFQIFFNLLNFAEPPLVLPDLTVEICSPPEVASKFDLTLYAKEQTEGINLELVYNAELFEPARMGALLEQLQYLLSQIVENSEVRIADFSLVTPANAVRLPNPVQTLDCEWEGSVCHQFSLQANRVPENLAVVDEREAWSYRELNVLSNQLANYLLACGIQSQEVVAIYARRSASLVWALLGVLKAGVAFAILDASYPASRLIDCLGATKPRLWLQLETAEQLPDALDDLVAKSCGDRLQVPQGGISAVRHLLSGYSTDDPGASVDPDDLAYVAFTSGSTGVPKGILGTHRPLSHFLIWQRQTFGLLESDRFSMLSGIAHDPLLRDIFAPLCLGATLCVPDRREMFTPEYLAQWMKQEQISIAHLTPAIGQLLTETTSDCPTANSLLSLRYVFFGGDVLTKRHVSQIRQLAPSVTCVNFYGTTETPQAMGYFIVPDDQGDVLADGERMSLKQVIPLGRGITDVQLLVLNASRRLAGASEVGEIYARTPYLFKGYINDDALTVSKFITNPFTQITADLLYKTGDLGYYLPDGNIQFLGRIDDQVKIRGFRIELGEIEAVLCQHDAVQATAVMVREDLLGDKRLLAYLVPKQQDTLAIVELRGFLKQKLPEYMMPSAFVLLDTLPLTPNGKVDRRQLAAIDRIAPDQEEIFVAPRTPLEEMLAGIWVQILGVEPVGIHDNFFVLGGHSLLAAQVISRVRQTFGLDLPLRSLFETPTIAGLASILTRSQPEAPQIDAINRSDSEIEPLLARLDELSEAEVDSWLSEILTEQGD